jgi:hypothetical protein
VAASDLITGPEKTRKKLSASWSLKSIANGAGSVPFTKRRKSNKRV